MPEPHQQYEFSHFDTDGDPVFRDTVYHHYYVVTKLDTPWSRGKHTPTVARLVDYGRQGLVQTAPAVVKKLLPMGLALMLNREAKDE